MQDIYTYKSNLYDFTYYDDDGTKADTMMDVVDEVDSDDD